MKLEKTCIAWGTILEVNEIIEALDIDVDKRLFQLTQKDLTKLLLELIKYKDKKTMATLISDDKYFQLSDLIKSLEKTDKSLLFKILNEPNKEQDLRLPIAQFIKNNWNYPEYQYEVVLPNTRRIIDVVGCKCGGLFSDSNIVAVEIKTSPTRSSIDSAFSQANDYLECSDFSYVAVSPFVFLKYPEVLLKKVKSYKNKIGLLLVDKMRVITEIEEAKQSKYDDEKYHALLSYFKK